MRGNSEVSLTFRVRAYWAEDVAQWVEYFLSIHEAPGLHLSIAQTRYGWHTLVILAGSRAGESRVQGHHWLCRKFEEQPGLYETLIKKIIRKNKSSFICLVHPAMY